MILIKIILKFLKILNSEADPWQIGAGFVVGLFLGLTPLLSFHNIFVVIALLFLRINITSALVSMGVFSAVSLATAGISNQIGGFLLRMESLEGIWRFLSETPGLGLFSFNNTLVLGSLILACIGALPVFLIITLSVSLYRHKLKEKIAKWKIVKYLKMTKMGKFFSAANRMR
jgi:uncharacterized protein (TIGR03546 family)